MKIIYKTGDLLECEEYYVVHGCNSLGAMGRGVAGAIRKKWPEVWKEYRSIYEERGLHVGEIVGAYASAGSKYEKYVYNAITQEFYGANPNFVYVSYEGLRECFKKINNEFEEVYRAEPIAMPKIGAGLANGDWEIISKIIEEECAFVQPVVYTPPVA